MNCMIKKILILLYSFCIAAALFAQQPQGEYIKAVRHYYKSDKFSSKMEVLILFDDEGYITYYEGKTVEPYIKADTVIIEGKREGDNYYIIMKEGWLDKDRPFDPPQYNCNLMQQNGSLCLAANTIITITIIHHCRRK